MTNEVSSDENEALYVVNKAYYMTNLSFGIVVHLFNTKAHEVVKAFAFAQSYE